MQQRRRDPIGITRWSVWALPRRALLFVVLVDLLAAGSLLVGFADGIAPQPRPWSITLAVLAVAGILSTEASLGVERMRRQSEHTPNIDLSSVWAFAAAALLPGPLAAVVVILIYGYMYLRLWRSEGIPPHRVLFSTATVVLAVQAAAPVVALGGGPTPFRSAVGLAAVAAGVVTYAAVNMSLVVAVIALSGPGPSLVGLRRLLGRGGDAVLEFATLSMGALTAGAVAEFGPAYAVLVLPPLIVLQRAVLVRQLEEEANFDSKTGLLNAAAWEVEAERAVRRIEQLEGNATVLVLDLDNFKQVNDEHGHLAGDQALVAVAEAIRDVVREGDLVGRFGGEEFVVLLPAPDGDPGRVGGRGGGRPHPAPHRGAAHRGGHVVRGRRRQRPERLDRRRDLPGGRHPARRPGQGGRRGDVRGQGGRSQPGLHGPAIGAAGRHRAGAGGVTVRQRHAHRRAVIVAQSMHFTGAVIGLRPVAVVCFPRSL